MESSRSSPLWSIPRRTATAATAFIGNVGVDVGGISVRGGGYSDDDGTGKDGTKTKDNNNNKKKNNRKSRKNQNLPKDSNWSTTTAISTAEQDEHNRTSKQFPSRNDHQDKQSFANIRLGSSFSLLSGPFKMYEHVRAEASALLNDDDDDDEQEQQQQHDIVSMPNSSSISPTPQENDNRNNKQLTDGKQEKRNLQRKDHQKNSDDDDNNNRGRRKHSRRNQKKRHGIRTAGILTGGGVMTTEDDDQIQSNELHSDSRNTDDDENNDRRSWTGQQSNDNAKEEQPQTLQNSTNSTESSSSPEESSSNGSSKLWWVNLWSDLMDDESSSDDQNSDDDEENDMDIITDDDNDDNDDDDDDDDILTSSDEIVQSENNDKDNKKQSNDTVLSSDNENDDNAVISKTVSPLLMEGKEQLSEDLVMLEADTKEDRNVSSQSSFVSSGAWVPIDNLLSFGLASKYPALRISRPLRSVRKTSARITGLHGALSGKPRTRIVDDVVSQDNEGGGEATIDEEEVARQSILRRRIAAIERAREGVKRAQELESEKSRQRRGLLGGLFGRKDRAEKDQLVATDDESESETDEADNEEVRNVPQKTPEEIQEEEQRMERVREIDRLISEGQARLQNLICEKDVLQRRPNPLFEYTTTETVTTEMSSNEVDVTVTEDSTIEDAAEAAATSTRTTLEIQATRKMTFPPDDLVDEYLDMMFSTRRLMTMNHTQLWQEETEEDEEETIGDDLFTPSANVRSLYEDRTNAPWKDKGNGGGGGSWLLRQSIGSGPTLGEKIGEAAETAAYKAVCKALMSFLARLLSSLHGINVLKHSDIRLVLEQAPDLPPLKDDDVLGGGGKNYAEETIKTVMRRKSRKAKSRSRRHFSSDDMFVQRDAVTEMLLSHVQISAPLLKLFPLAWQRALLGNIITLSTAVISDFLDGLSFQILGHQLSFSFRPITEEDLVQHFRLAGGRFNHRRYKPAEFEAAVQATAEDVSDELKFLDRWHERALGSGVLRTQIANMIARIVLTLTDEILSGARMDLWSSQANGPRILAGLEYRTEEDEV